MAKILLALLVAFALAQFIRPSHTNPPIDPTRTIQAQAGMTELGALLDRSCSDCHANQTRWPWYTNVAPVSWLMASAVTKGRDAVNFSEWTGYSPAQQRTLLALSCEDASTGKMPGVYARVRPDTRLSARDIATICAAARQAGTRATDASR